MSKLTLSFKDHVLKIFPVQKGSMIIGSDPKCAVHIDSLAVQPQHAKLDTHGQVSVISDLGTEDGTFVNNKKIDGVHTLKDGDVLRVGKHLLAFTYEEIAYREDQDILDAILDLDQNNHQSSSTIDARTGWLQILNGSNLGKTMNLNRSMTNLGKPGITKAVITRREDGYFLAHLEGKFPPLVGDTPIGNKSHKLNDGDTIQIGNIKMQFYYE